MEEINYKHKNTFLFSTIISDMDSSRMEKRENWDTILDRSQKILREGYNSVETKGEGECHKYWVKNILSREHCNIKKLRQACSWGDIRNRSE